MRSRLLDLPIVLCLPIVALIVMLSLAGAPAADDAPATPPPVGTPEEVLKTATVRVALLRLEPGTATDQHTHNDPHLAVALTDGTLTSIAADGTATPREMHAGAPAYVPPGVTHALRNDGVTPFRAVTVDLLTPQTGGRNRCAALFRGLPTDCPRAEAKPKGVMLQPQMETDQTLVSLLTLEPGKERRFEAAAMAPVVVALGGAQGIALIEVRIAGGAVGKGEKPLREGDAATGLAKSPLAIRNSGTLPARFLVVEFR